MWNECFSSNCFLALTVSWCEVKVWESWGEKRGSKGRWASKPRETHRHPEKWRGWSQLEWLWWSHRQSVYDFKGFLLQAASASPMCSCFCSGHSSHATLQNVPWVSHSVSAQTQTAASVLPHPANAGGGTPLGVLLAIVIIPARVDLFLCYQIRFIHQRAPPNTSNFNVKTHQIAN